MWYTVLRTELQWAGVLIRAGSIYQAKKYTENVILFLPQEGHSAKLAGRFKLPVSQARVMFTKPTKSFGDAVEESIMQCEANYC